MKPTLFKNTAQGDFPSILAAMRKFAESTFENARKSHDWEHTERVYRLCRHIGLCEGADMAVVEIAAYLHDIGRGEQDRSNGKVCHAKRGAQITQTLIAPLPLADAQKQNIVHCVRAHRFREAEQPATIEAKVLFDADKLDAIGAVGIARAYLFAGEVGAKLHNTENDISRTRAYSAEDTGYREYIVKLRKIKDRMLTASGRKMAVGRHRLMELFFDHFLEEYAGNI